MFSLKNLARKGLIQKQSYAVITVLCECEL